MFLFNNIKYRNRLVVGSTYLTGIFIGNVLLC